MTTMIENSSSTPSPSSSPRRNHQPSDDLDTLPASSPVSSSTTLNQAYSQVTPTQETRRPAEKMAKVFEVTEPSLTQTRGILDTVSETFPSFDVHSAIVQPFQDETNRDASFERELASMILDVMLEFHAWSAARPRGESESSGHVLEERIGSVMKVEMEQGRSSTALSRLRSIPFSLIHSTFIEETRRRLGEFIRQVKTALDALTGLAM